MIVSDPVAYVRDALETHYERMIAVDSNFIRFGAHEVHLHYEGGRYRVQYLGDRSVTEERWLETADETIRNVVEHAARERAEVYASRRFRTARVPYEKLRDDHYARLIAAAYAEDESGER